MSLKRKISTLAIGFSLAGIFPAAAQPRFEAPLNAIPADGFYRIAMTPEIGARSLNWPQDLRILDAKKVQVAYVPEARETAQQTIVSFPVITEALDTQRQSFVTIENSSRYNIGELYLDVKNTEAIRALTLSGSDDQQNWYAVREGFYWNETGSGNQEKFSAVITFPTVSYRFLRLTFIGRGKLPVKVLSVSAHGSKAGALQAFVPLPSPSISQKDSSNKKSYIHFHFASPYYTDRISLEVTGPKYFHRTGSFYDASGQNLLSETVLSSGTQSVMLPIKGKDFYLEINNDDNPPLKIAGVKAFQEQRAVIAYLLKDQDYQLAFGDSLAQRPVYDLAFFKDSIGRDIPTIAPGDVVVRATHTDVAPTGAFKQWMLWPLLALLLGGLLYITLKMVKRVDAKEG